MVLAPGINKYKLKEYRYKTLNMKQLKEMLISERHIDIPYYEFTRVKFDECVHNLKQMFTNIIIETHKDKQKDWHELMHKLLDVLNEYEK